MHLNSNLVNNDNCKGLVFRAQVRHYKTVRGLGFTVRLNVVKRMSCPGCDKCLWQYDSFNEVCNDWPIIGIESAEDNKLYVIESCNESRDWETGYIDSFDLKLVEYSPV